MSLGNLLNNSDYLESLSVTLTDWQHTFLTSTRTWIVKTSTVTNNNSFKKTQTYNLQIKHQTR